MGFAPCVLCWYQRIAIYPLVLIFGVGTIFDFAMAMLIGIISGTYSTIYIASAIVLFWHKGQRPQTSTTVTMETSAAPAKA